jgi:hypothetical protein
MALLFNKEGKGELQKRITGGKRLLYVVFFIDLISHGTGAAGSVFHGMFELAIAFPGTVNTKNFAVYAKYNRAKTIKVTSQALLSPGTG